jgi:endonuclease-3 related protein
MAQVLYEDLYSHYGPQHWWPGDSVFEIMVGAVLTQNTAWTNVERAIGNLKSHDLLFPDGIGRLDREKLAQLIRPAGYFNVKAQRLHNLCEFLQAQGGETSLSRMADGPLRESLLGVNGVGPETADDIMLYAFERPVFVIDAYTRRLFSRIGLIAGDENYEKLRSFFESNLESNVDLFNEYHALIVSHAKNICTRNPRCFQCCIKQRCDYFRGYSPDNPVHP